MKTTMMQKSQRKRRIQEQKQHPFGPLLEAEAGSGKPEVDSQLVLWSSWAPIGDDVTLGREYRVVSAVEGSLRRCVAYGEGTSTYESEHRSQTW